MTGTARGPFKVLDQYSLEAMWMKAGPGTQQGLMAFGKRGGYTQDIVKDLDSRDPLSALNGFVEGYLKQNGLGQKAGGRAWGSTGDIKKTPQLVMREKMQAALGFVDTQALGLSQDDVKKLAGPQGQGLEGLKGPELEQALKGMGISDDAVKAIAKQGDKASATVGQIHRKEIIDGKVGPVTRAAWEKFMANDGAGQKFARNAGAGMPAAETTNPPTFGAETKPLVQLDAFGNPIPAAGAPADGKAADQSAVKDAPGEKPGAFSGRASPYTAMTQIKPNGKSQLDSATMLGGTGQMTAPAMAGEAKKVKTVRITATPQGMKELQSAETPAAAPQAAAKGDRQKSDAPTTTDNSRVTGGHDLFKKPGEDAAAKTAGSPTGGGLTNAQRGAQLLRNHAPGMNLGMAPKPMGMG